MDIASISCDVVANQGATRSVELQVNEYALDELTVLAVKRQLAAVLGLLTPSGMRVSIGDQELDDEWVGEDYGLQVRQ